MIANIIAVAIIVFWAGFVVLSVLKKKRRERKNGIPAGCYSCKIISERNVQIAL